MMRPGIRRYLRLRLFRRGLIEAQVEEEILLHIELRIEQLMRKGLSRGEARREALRRFGSMEQAGQRLRSDAWRREGVMRLRDAADAMLLDLRYVLRAMRSAPGFTATIVLTLALGIGANAAMFGILDRLMLRGPEHIVDRERVQRMYLTVRRQTGGEATFNSTGYVLFAALRDQGRAFERVAAHWWREQTLGRAADSEQINMGVATWDLFPTLGVQPARGRFFNAGEDRPLAGENVVVLSHELWQRRYAGETSVLGTTIDLGGVPFTVVGVAPRGFTGPELLRMDVWVPMAAVTRTRDDWPTTWLAQWLTIVARLRPDVTSESAGEDATRVLRAVYPAERTNLREATLSFRPLHAGDSGQEPAELAVARWLIGVSAIVLMIACANVANLLLARALRRRREVALRVALGISRLRLTRLLLTETMMLAGLGGVAGLLVAQWGGQFIRVLLLPDVLWTQPPVNARVLGFSLLAVVLTGLLIGLVPVVQSLRSDLGAALKTGVRESGGRRSRLRGTLTIAQAALSVVLLVGAGLFVKSLWNVRNLDLGFEPERVLTVSPRWPASPGLTLEQRVALAAQRQQFWNQALERVRSMPEVASASSAVGTPFHSNFSVDLRVPGYDSLPNLPGGGPYISAVQAGFMETLGIRLLSGRDFNERDRRGSERVAIVSETMAATLWPGRAAVGQCLIIFADSIPCARIVGVVENARRYELREETAMQYYVPLGQEMQIGGRELLIRPRGDADDFREPLRRLLQSMEPNVLHFNMRTLQQEVDPLVRPWRLGAFMFAIFGALALLIAAIGLYSVIAYLVSSRTQELGVRMALGARGADIRNMILRQGMVLTMLGAGAGLVLALAGGRFLSSMLFDTSARDPAVYVAVLAALLSAALLACIIPARRALRVNPVDALKNE